MPRRLRVGLLVCPLLALGACDELDLSKAETCIFPYAGDAPPNVVLLEPADGDFVGEQPSFLAEASDDRTAPEALELEWWVGGETVCAAEVVDTEGLARCAPLLEPGSYIVQVAVTDELGARATSTVDVVVETAPPTVHIVDPMDGSTQSSPFTFVAEAHDSRTPPEALTITWAVDSFGVCADSVVDASGTATCAPELSAGSHTIVTTVEDDDYGRASDTITVRYAPE